VWIWALVCRPAPGRAARLHALNDCILHALEAAGIPTTEEPSGLVRSDGKRPESCSLIPWCSGKSLTWDVTAACTAANSYLQASSREPGAVAELSANRKEAKESMILRGIYDSEVSGDILQLSKNIATRGHSLKLATLPSRLQIRRNGTAVKSCEPLELLIWGSSTGICRQSFWNQTW